METESVDADVREIKATLKLDFEFFIEFFLGDSLDMEVPEFHKQIWSLMTDQEKERVLLAIPRDHAKTTLAKLCVIWYWLFTSHRFCAYLSNTNPIAKGACKDIVQFLRHPNFVAVFGEVKWVKESEMESLWIFDLQLAGGRVKRCILRAVGQGQQMRGINIDNQRPDITVVDDVEDNDNTDSEFQQKKLDKWMFGPFLKALARKKKIIWLGNMLSKKSLLARLSRVPSWNPVVFGALIKDSVTGEIRALWPEKWSIQALMDDFQEYVREGLVETWMCEMMNMPGHGKNGFTADQLNLGAAPTPDSCQAVWITVDPAFGENLHNDESAIAVHAIEKGGSVPITVTVVHGRWSESLLLDEILKLAFYWNAWTWGIEAVAAQKVLISLFQLLLARRQLHNRAVMIPLMAGKGDPKVSRIRAWVSLMAEREWVLAEFLFDVVSQLMDYDGTKSNESDDIIDACAYGPMMLENHLPLIMAQSAGQDVFAMSAPKMGWELENV